MNAKQRPLRIALTADLHYGTRHTAGNLATLQLVTHLCEHPPDVLILAGDIGAGEDFTRCLDLFAPVSCLKALVPGNHDIWVTSTDPRGDSLRLYQQLLPELANERGFHYLDHGPLLLPEYQLALVGSMNWYDYSWAIEELKQTTPDWAERLRAKRFIRGRHNDANYVRWPFTDESFTQEAVSTLVKHLDDGLAQMDQAIVVTHHPAFRGLNYPAPEPHGLDELLWKAFSGNARLEQELALRSERIAFTFCGHTHCARENRLASIQGFNIGGDYHFKRLLWLDWPSGRIEAVRFGS
ncbi:MAG: metallophosphoesterase [Planctomycetes bacterium]|nr:metallophosphoesterase [Planctomycetota bacterium]